MRSIRWASGTMLAIALGVLGCGGSSKTPSDASVDRRGTDSVGVDSGGASSLDSGVGDLVVVESGVRDGATERSIPTEVGPALDLAGADTSAPPDALTDKAVGGQDSGLHPVDGSGVGCPDGYHLGGNGLCVVNGTC